MLTDVGAAALLIAVLVQTTKFLLGYAVSSTSPNQNAFTRLYVFGVAVLVVLGTDWAYNGLHSHADVINAVKFALSAGAVAIASYHLLTSNAVPALIAGVSPLKPYSPDPAPAVVELVPTPAPEQVAA